MCLLGRTWMAATRCNIDWATNKVNMVIPSCPTGSHCTHCSPLQKLTLLEGPTELASQKPNPKLTPNAITTNTLAHTKAGTNALNNNQLAATTKTGVSMGSQNKDHNAERSLVARRGPRSITFQVDGCPRTFFANKGILRAIFGFGSQKVFCFRKVQGQEQSKQQPCFRKIQENLQAAGCPKTFLQAQGYYEGNPWIWLPKNDRAQIPNINNARSSHSSTGERKTSCP